MCFVVVKLNVNIIFFCNCQKTLRQLTLFKSNKLNLKNQRFKNEKNYQYTYTLFLLVLCNYNKLIAQNISCDTVVQSSSGFDINPLTLLVNPLKSKNILTVQNIGCNNLRVRPDFIISHESQNLQINDIASLKWQIPNVMVAPIEIAATAISVNSSGQIVGYFSGLNGDSTGYDLNINQTRGVEITVKLRPNAPFGEYSAYWFTNKVDSLGNIIQYLSAPDTTTLYYLQLQ